MGDDFVRNKLTEWGLSGLIHKFEEEAIDEECLFHDLNDEIIDRLITKTGPNLRFKRHLASLKAEAQANINGEASDSANVGSPASASKVKGKRKRDNQEKSSTAQPPPKQCIINAESNSESNSDEEILSEAGKIMKSVSNKLQDKTKLSMFLKSKIGDLLTEKRELVGVFGRTGAGKSSLINAVIEEKKLLPSGSITACTSVIVKVETHILNVAYEAEIEFITKQDWKDEVWSMLQCYKDNPEESEDQGDMDDDSDKLLAVYGEEWELKRNADELMNPKYFGEIPEFLVNKKKTLTGHSRHDLSNQLKKYTTADKKDGVKRLYWPLVKCVTIRLPENPHLPHVTLVDLPGSGDRNKSRDTMWKEIIGKCSVVWIVADINRPAAEKEAWEILEDTCNLMGNGGQCQTIYFICTKSDVVDDADDLPAEEVRDCILKRNKDAKDEVKKEFKKLRQKHFSADDFTVITVSSNEFTRGKWLNQEETEIPRLQKILKDLNDNHSETLNYVSGARGILSLIQGARCSAVTAERNEVYKNVEKNMERELQKIDSTMEAACKEFETCLRKGVEESKSSWEKDLQKLLHPKKGNGFHRTLRAVVENGGIHKPKKKREINFNAKLTSHLTDSIDEQFKKTFPNGAKHEAFNGVISKFSLNTEKLIEKYQDVKLHLLFLQTEEAKIKSVLGKFVQGCKKKIYNRLMETIAEDMDECYTKAAEIKGKNSLSNMRDVILQHVRASKDTMFERAMENMMTMMKGLKTEVLKTLRKVMQESIEISLKEDGHSLPDVSGEYDMMENYKQQLEKNRLNGSTCEPSPGLHSGVSVTTLIQTDLSPS